MSAKKEEKAVEHTPVEANQKDGLFLYPSGQSPWAMKISPDGKITFNKAAYQTAEPKEFADMVIEILENTLLFNFQTLRREGSNDRT